MRLKEKKLLKKFAATLKKFSAQGAKKVEYGRCYRCFQILGKLNDNLCGKGLFFASVYHAFISRTLVSLCTYFFSVFVLSAGCGCIIVLLIYFFLFDGQPKWVPFAPEFQFCYF